MLIKDLLNLVFHAFEDGHDMLNFSEINRKCHQIFHQNIKIENNQLETETKCERKYMKNNQDQKHGICRYVSHREVKYEYNYVQGQLHGIAHAWYQDNTIYFEQRYYQGLLHGIQRAWYPNGILESVQTLYLGNLHGFLSRWRENGTIRYKYNYHHGQRHGISCGWTPNGQLLFTNNYVNGVQQIEN